MAKSIVLKQANNVPDTETSLAFHQLMVDAMGMSYFKYGPVAEGYPERINALESLRLRLERYIADGNTEWLVDVANIAMIEFMRPSHSKAHFKATDSGESPGRVWHPDEFDGTVEISRRANDLSPEMP